jgi:hypothetical protein
MSDIQTSCHFCKQPTEELKLVLDNGGDVLACYTCRQYRRPARKEVSYAIR